MKAHAIVAAVTLAVALLICAAAGPIDKGAVDTGKLWKEAHKRAVKGVGQ